MVAYASVMRHWDVRRGRPADAFSVDPTLWSVGQVVGLRRAAEAIARRAGKTSYQGLAEFPHFAERNCYECHHKLVADGMRQAEGHYAMVDTIFAAVFPADHDRLQASWKALGSAVTTSATDTEVKAHELAVWLAPFEAGIVERGVGREPSARILRQLLAMGASIRPRTFDAHPPKGPPGSLNVVTIENIDLPWWYATGPAQQVALALQTLCGPVFGRSACSAVQDELVEITTAASPFAFDRKSFVSSLSAIGDQLPASP
jgi:hypothetical protein